jgi:hypothetical protein
MTEVKIKTIFLIVSMHTYSYINNKSDKDSKAHASRVLRLYRKEAVKGSLA